MNTDNRLETIDQFRGIAIILMALTHFLSQVAWIPVWLKNTNGYGLNPPDFIAPMFIFTIALTYGLSFTRRLQRFGLWSTRLHFIRRSLALIGLGFLITPEPHNWGLFQSLGTAVLLTLPVIRLSSWIRLAVAVVIQIGYQLLLSFAPLSINFLTVGSGILWSLSWSAMLIGATALADLFFAARFGKKAYLISSGITLSLGIFLSIWIPVSEVWGTSSFVLIGLGGSAILFVAYDWISKRFCLHLPLLSAWGQNPLVLYVLHYYMWVYFFLAPEELTWHIQAPVWQVGLQGLAFFTVLSAISWYLHRRQWILSI